MTTQTTPDHVALLNVYLEMPGLRLDVPSALRFAELVVTPLEFALANAQLLATSQPSRQLKEAAFNSAVVLGKFMEAVKEKRAEGAELAKLLAVPDKIGAMLDGSIEALGTTALGALKRIHGGSAIMAFAQDNWLLLSVRVTDLSRAGTILFAELEGLNLLHFCEVAAFDPARNSLRTVFPLNCDKPFERHWVLFYKLVAESKRKLEAFLDKAREGKAK